MVKISIVRACSDYTHIIDDQAAVTSAQFRVVDYVANYTDSPTLLGLHLLFFIAFSRISLSLSSVFPLKIIEFSFSIYNFLINFWPSLPIVTEIYCYVYIYIIRHGRDISKIDLIRNKNQYWSFDSMTFNNCNFQFTILQHFHHRLYPSSSLWRQDNAWKAVPQKVQFPCNLSCWMDSNYVLLDHQQVDIACVCVYTTYIRGRNRAKE